MMITRAIICDEARFLIILLMRRLFLWRRGFWFGRGGCGGFWQSEQSQFSRLQNYICRDRGRHRRAVTAPFDHDSDGKIWFFERRDTDEPAIGALVHFRIEIFRHVALAVLA